MSWLSAYGIESAEEPSSLGEEATLTVILRELTTDERSHAFLAIERTAPGEAQEAAIGRRVKEAFPDAREKTYNQEKQVASFVGQRHLYIVIYEEHELDAAVEVGQARLFAA